MFCATFACVYRTRPCLLNTCQLNSSTSASRDYVFLALSLQADRDCPANQGQNGKRSFLKGLIHNQSLVDHAIERSDPAVSRGVWNSHIHRASGLSKHLVNSLRYILQMLFIRINVHSCSHPWAHFIPLSS